MDTWVTQAKIVFRLFLGAIIFACAIGSASAQSFTLNLKDAEIQTLITSVAEMTGKNFIVDPRVKGKVTVISARPLRDDEIYQVFLSVLRVHGYVAIPSGSVVKIVPEAAGRNAGATVGGGSDELVTRVVRIRNVPASKLVPTLRPMMPATAHLAADDESNTLVISDAAGNVERLLRVIRRMDVASNAQMQVVRLQHASAGDVAATLAGLQNDQVSGARIVADERTNSLVISGDRGARDRLRAVIADLDQPMRGGGNTQVVRLSYASAADLVPVLEGITGGAAQAKQGEEAARLVARTTIQADAAMNALVITTTPAHMQVLQQVVAQLDFKRSQVLVEAVIADMSADKAKQFGVQWRLPTDPQSSGLIGGTDFGAGSLAALASNPLGVASGLSLGLIDGAFSFNGREFANFALLVRALASDAATNILSTPSIVTLDNQQAEIVVAQNVPFLTGQFTNTGANEGAANPFQTIERQDVGIILRVKPQINKGDSLKLEIEQEVSSIAPTTSVQGSNNAVDIITNRRSIRTTVMVEDGKVLVLGGLIDDNVVQSREKVPVLGDLPVLGNLFRFDSSSLAKRNLMVFLRPRIMRDDMPAKVSAARYQQTRAGQTEARKKGILLMPEETTPLLPSLQGFMEQLSAPTSESSSTGDQ
jgi:general secretion pathway protein D